MEKEMVMEEERSRGYEMKEMRWEGVKEDKEQRRR